MAIFKANLDGDVLYGIRETLNPEAVKMRAFDPGLGGVAEVFQATFTNHAYPMHSHNTWTLLIVDDGAIRYDIENNGRGADTRRVTVLPPHVAHDGEPARPGHGFRKRVLYLDIDAIGEELVGSAVDNSTVDDPGLRTAISRLHVAFGHTRDDLEWETRLGDIIRRIHRHLTQSDDPSARPPKPAASALRDYLESRLFEHHRLEDIADYLGWNKTHLVRSFSTEYGIPPHRYLTGRRVEEARQRLLAGQPAAEVAVEVGFYDQAHLTRHFRTHLSTTPAHFQHSATRTSRSLR